MKPIWSIGTLFLLVLSGLLGACGNLAEVREVVRTDSLNEVAYGLRYKEPAQSRQAAWQAYSAAEGYATGKAEACNHLGFCAFMEMDFAAAEQYYKEVYMLTKNELELLVADIGWMRICQRKALNKEFYDYRNRALRRMKRISEDANLFVEPHEQMRLAYAQSEFYLVSAVYYYYLQQRADAWTCIQKVKEADLLKTDTNQLLYFHYLKGAAELCEGDSPEEQRLREFDELYATWRIASLKGYRYFEGNGLQGMVNLMSTPKDYALVQKHRSHALLQFGLPLDSLLPLRLGQQALQLFRAYENPYQIAGAYVSIGKYLNMHGCYAEALDTLTLALECVNNLKGMAPECLSRICEQQSVSYAGLGEKQSSDYHRNIYLDILDDTRQDKELESRYQALEQEAKQLNVWLASVMVGLVGVVCFFWFFNRRSKAKSQKHVQRLQGMLEMCQQITSAIPTEVQTEEELVQAIEDALRPSVQRLFGVDEVQIIQGELTLNKHLNRDEQAILQVLNPYVQWALANGMASISLGEEQRSLEKKRYVYEQHIALHKRQNLVKKACMGIVNGVQPYIDRIINEVQKTKLYGEAEEIRQKRYLYIEELVDRINEYHEIMALWIKMKQGTLSLNIETFELEELFALLRKGSRAFELKKQRLEVKPTDLTVKADKALTMFMLNTLAENARKYTQQGACIRVSAEAGEGYVEIAVEDNGPGLSAQKQEDLLKNKGSGFGLMNCRGIIEKYRKTNALFQVCRFGWNSEQGQGSRFYFRLPVGVRKLLILILFSLGWGGVQAEDSWNTPEQEAYEALLDSASDYANEAYYCNIYGDFDWALQYIDSAMMCLNQHYMRYSKHPKRVMAMMEYDVPAELEWWEEPFNSDFHVILDIRNEAAVAFLALKRWEEYRYNNGAYTTLYKILGEDQSLESYCRQLERSTRNKMVGMWLCILLGIVWLLGYYILYIRKRWMNRWNLEQVLEINRQVFAAAQISVTPQQMVDAAYDAVNDLLSIDCLGIAVYNESAQNLEFAFRSVKGVDGHQLSRQVLMQRCFEQERCVNEEGRQILPLVVETGGVSRCIGVLCLDRQAGTVQETDALLLELIARYMAVVAFNTVVKLAVKYRDIELAEDEARRASWEDNILHVQNQVLDNCLSTIKHETVYYPHKIKQLVGKLRSEGLSEEEKRETVLAIGELIGYYKEIFTILSRCAARQLEEVTFRRSVLSVSDLQKNAEKYFQKMTRNRRGKISLIVKTLEASVLGDRNQLQFLLENLIDEALSVDMPGELELSAVSDSGFIRFQFTDSRRNRSQEELNQLFYPSLQRMAVDSQGQLRGTEYLLAKQIIREHDEYIGHRGCRINAEVNPAGGFTVYFTVLQAKNQ